MALDECRNLFCDAKSKLGLHPREHIEKQKQLSLQFSLRFLIQRPVTLGLPNERHAKTDALSIEPGKRYGSRIVEKVSQFPTTNPKLDHIGAIKNLGRKHVGRFVNVNGADDEEVCRQGDLTRNTVPDCWGTIGCAVRV